MPYHHLTPMERGQIQALVERGESFRAIARSVGRSPSTICREVARNGGRGRAYEADRSQSRYQRVRKACRRTLSLSHLPLRRYPYEKISAGWSPEQVSGRLWLDFPGQPRMRVSHETIYRSLYADEKLGNVLLGHLRQRRPRRRKRGERRPTRPLIPNRVGIEARPVEVNQRARYGDWEGDLMIGAQQQGAVLTLVERKSLYLSAKSLASRHAAGVAKAAIDALIWLPKNLCRTITFDNGSEFAHHESMTDALGAAIYFAHPYSAWERGCNENINGLLRQYLPKTTTFKDLSDQRLQHYVNELNDRPRKKLRYRTPTEVFLEHAVALAP